MSTYARSFEIHASHFNGGPFYHAYKLAMQTGDTKILNNVLINTHGHNFQIHVLAETYTLDDEGFVIDDEQLEALVREWDRTNLSVHPDFGGERATTERMAEKLVAKVIERFAGNTEAPLFKRLKVIVDETPTISASFSWPE